MTTLDHPTSTRSTSVQNVLLAAIVLDPALQMRSRIDERTVNLYRREMIEGEKFPPVEIVVVGRKMLLVNGWHRVRAATLNEFTEIEAIVTPGDYRAAMLAAVAANKHNAKQRADEDIRRAVDTMLDDPEWSGWSDRAISRHVGCSPTFVGTRRAALLTVRVDSEKSAERTFTTKHGRTATMNTAKIGKKSTATPSTAATPALPPASETPSPAPASSGLPAAGEGGHGLDASSSAPAAASDSNPLMPRAGGEEHDLIDALFAEVGSREAFDAASDRDLQLWSITYARRVYRLFGRRALRATYCGGATVDRLLDQENPGVTDAAPEGQGCPTPPPS